MMLMMMMMMNGMYQATYFQSIVVNFDLDITITMTMLMVMAMAWWPKTNSFQYFSRLIV